MGAACGGGSGSPGVVVSDSAGIEIVTNHRTFAQVPVRAGPAAPEGEPADEALFEVSVIQPLADGRVAVGGVEDRLIVGTGEHPEVRVFGRDGEFHRVVRWMSGDRAVTRERMVQFVQFQLGAVPPEEASFLRDRLAGMPFAPERPTHSDVLSAPDGSLWVGEYPGPEAEMPSGRRLAPRRWVVFAGDGTIPERIEIPTRFMPMALTDGLAWGVYYDQLGVESVRAYRTDP